MSSSNCCFLTCIQISQEALRREQEAKVCKLLKHDTKVGSWVKKKKLWYMQNDHLKWKWKSFSQVQLFVTPWTVAHQTPLSVEFSRQDYRSGLPFPLPGDLSDLGIELTSPAASALAGGFFTTVPLGRPFLLFEGECLSIQRWMRLSTGWWGCHWHDSSGGSKGLGGHIGPNQ